MSKDVPQLAIEDLQRAVREWIEREHPYGDGKPGGNQRAAARALGIPQGQLSTFLGSGTSLGELTLRRLARIAPREVTAYMGLPAAPAGEPRSLPSLERAIELTRGKVHPRAIAYARALAHLWPADRPLGDWVEEIEAFDAVMQREGAHT